jgi:integrase
MPWLEPDQSGSFHVAFRFNGRRFRRSLKTSDRREAERLAARVEDNIRLIERGRIVVPSDVDVATFLMSDCRIGGTAPKRAGAETLTQLFAVYFEQVGSDKLEESTLQGMRIHRGHLERLLGKRLCLAATNAATLQSYIDKRSKEKYRGRLISPATIKKEIVTVRTIWNFAWHLEFVGKPYPGKKLAYPKTEARLPFRTLAEVEERIARGNLHPDYVAQMWESVFLSTEELAEFLSHVKAHAEEPYAYLLFMIAAHTGARRSEILRSEIDDLDLHSGTINIRERKRVRGARSVRSVPMSQQLECAIREWLKVHPGGQHTFPELVRAVSSSRTSAAKVELLVDRAHDIFRRTVADSRWQNLSGYHMLRHSFCSNCAASGIDQRVIDAFVGHLSPDTVRRYRHLLPRQARHSIDSVFG